MKKIAIIGCFASQTELFDGQTIKIRTLSKELSKIYGDNCVSKIDTYLWKKNIVKLINDIVYQFKKNDSIIMLPAENGLKVFAPLLILLNLAYKRKISYIVIGGWLYEFLQNNKYLINILKKFDGIYVETKNMELKLETLGLENIHILPNFKSIDILEYNEVCKPNNEILKLCTFSRVMREKGITNAIEITKKLRLKGIKCTLDIFGKIDESYENEFFELLKLNEECIHYKGVIDANSSVSVLKNYDIMLFLTYYEGEGFPGTLIDALFAGIPVIATNWKYNDEIVIPDITGYLIDLNDDKQAIEYISKLNTNKKLLIDMKKTCLEEAKKYTPSKVLPKLLERI